MMIIRVLLIVCMLAAGTTFVDAKESEGSKSAKESRRSRKREAAAQSQEQSPRWTIATEATDSLASGERLIEVVDLDELRPGVPAEVVKNRGRRVDREINKRLFIQKGEYMFGLSGSYCEFNSDNAEMLLALTDISVDGSISSIKPFAGYFYRDNRAAGGRFSYSTYSGTLDSATIDLGETNDISFDIPYINVSNDSYGYSLFHRSYAALDDKGHFGLFAEVELSAAYGDTMYEYMSGDTLKTTHSKNQNYSICFNPGLSAFIYNNVCASLSFEFGGLHYTKIKQYDADGVFVGERDYSKMQFMFNIFAINFGITVHIW